MADEATKEEKKAARAEARNASTRTAKDNRQQDYITNVRQQATNLWAAYNALLAFQQEWNAQDYGNNLADGTGANEGITATEVGSVVHDTANAMATLMADGHGTNLTNIKL